MKAIWAWLSENWEGTVALLALVVSVYELREQIGVRSQFTLILSDPDAIAPRLSIRSALSFCSELLDKSER